MTPVLGSIDARSLGRTYYHEHLFQITPLLPGDELDDEDASRQEAARLRESGFDAMIDATPTGLGRNPAALARISQALTCWPATTHRHPGQQGRRAMSASCGTDDPMAFLGFRLVFDDLAKEQAFTDPYIATLQQLRAGGVRETLDSLLRSAED